MRCLTAFALLYPHIDRCTPTPHAHCICSVDDKVCLLASHFAILLGIVVLYVETWSPESFIKDVTTCFFILQFLPLYLMEKNTLWYVSRKTLNLEICILRIWWHGILRMRSNLKKSAKRGGVDKNPKNGIFSQWDIHTR